MKVLHVVGNEINKSNGIGAMIPPMIENQNENSEFINSDLLLINKQCYFNEKFKIFCYDKINLNVLKRYDVVIFHGLYFFKYYLISRFLIKEKIPYLIKPHSSLMLEAQKKSFLKKKIANYLIFNYFIRNSAGVIYTSKGEKDRSSVQRGKLYIEPNGIEIKNNSELDVSNDILRLIYIGRIDIHHKGLDVLLESLLLLKHNKCIDSFKFEFFGAGLPRDESRFKEMIKQLCIENITFNGPIFDKEKELALENSDIFVLTSRYEGVPMAILESLSHGVPCLVTPGTNIGESVEEYNFGWICNFDSKSISDKIIEIVSSNKKSILQKKINAKNYILNNNSWPVVVKRTELILIDVFKSHNL